MEDLVWVDVGACRCPGAPHPVDRVALAPRAPIEVGAAVMGAIRAAGDREGALHGLLARSYVLGIRDWTFLDEAGHRIRPDVTSDGFSALVDELLPWSNGGADVADKADELYSEEVLRPLISRTSRLSQGGRTDGSTSPTPDTGPKPPEPSSPSSPSDTDGKPSGDPDP